MPKWSGSMPAKISLVMRHFGAVDGFPHGFRNRLIIHGPPGNGKTTLAQIIADDTCSRLFRLDGPSIVNRYQGSGAERIDSVFQEAVNSISGYDMNSVIFIDEIDAIAANTDNEHRGEFKAALQQLWIQLDAHKNNRRLLVVCATNNLTHLHKTFLDRFGANIVEIGNPDSEQRERLFERYLSCVGIPYNRYIIFSLAYEAHGLSARCIEDVVSDYAMESMESTTCNGHKAIDEKKMIALIDIARAKFKGNEADDRMWKKKLERTSLYLAISSGFLATLVHADYIRKLFFPRPATLAQPINYLFQ